MCLNVIGNKQVASKAIQVYKVLKLDNTAPHRNLGYLENVVHVEKNMRARYGQVDAGLHAFVTLQGAKRHRTHYNLTSSTKVVVGFIPEGSTYYLGTKDEIVSDHMYFVSLENII